MLKYLAIFLALSAIYGWHIHKEITDSFCAYSISPAAQYRTIQNEKLDIQTLEILDEKFTFLDKGAQCFAFESESGNYVLKIFKQKRLRPALWQKLFIQMPMVEHIALKTANFKKRNRALLSEGISVASTLCRDLTGLIYVHPYPADNEKIYTTIDGKPWDLSKYAFVLQVKAEPLIKVIQSKSVLITSLLPLLKERAKRGVFDKDSKFLNNVGFVKGRPQFIDFGEFAIDARMIQEEFASRYIEKQLESLSPYFFNLYTCDKFSCEIR